DIMLPSGAPLAPWPELEGGALDALDVLLRLLRVLERHERLLAEAMPPAQWRERLLGLLDAVLPAAPAQAAGQRALERLRALVGAFAAAAGRADVALAVPAEVVRAHFAAALAEADTRAPLLTGGVSFGRMVPMRLLPFRAICVLGMNDGDYPRRDPAAGLNRLAAELGTAHRRHGDRSLREDDRFLFLQLFASAGDVFYVSYLGADARDGSAREPSVLVSELLEAAAAHHADPANARAALAVWHPLQPFAPTAFGPADEPRRFSYHGEWRPAAGQARGAGGALAPWCGAPLAVAGAADEVLTIAGLRRFLRDPAGAFLRQRLGLRLPEAVEEAEDIEPLLLPRNGLERLALQDAVLAAAIVGDTAALPARLRARGLLPPGPLAERELEALLVEARDYARLFTDWRAGAEAIALPIDFALDGVRLQGHVAGVYPHGLARLRMGAPNGPSVIRDGLDWLLANAAGQRVPLVNFHHDGERPTASERDGIDPDSACDALRALLRLRAQGLAEPLPWGAYAGWAWFGADDADKALKAARERWSGRQAGWAEGEADAFRLTLRGRDLFEDPALRARFAAITRAVFVPLTTGRPWAADAGEAAA
ncbi:MAG: exodeoxyribonuclease V subunit gamma, partial [Lysobacteraceae bacterium]